MRGGRSFSIRGIGIDMTQVPRLRRAVERWDDRFLRRVSGSLRLFGARPTDTLELAGPMPARVASALGLPSRDAFLTQYRARTQAVREAYTRAMAAGDGAA